MTTIPDDIREQSWDIARRAIVHAWDVTPSRGESHLAEAVAQALAAERERCALIALTRRSIPSRDIDQYSTTLAIDIATAIRSQTP